MGAVFSMMTPMRSLLKYNLDMLEVVDDEKKLLNFLRWRSGSPTGRTTPARRRSSG
jgi:hypothetical protein